MIIPVHIEMWSTAIEVNAEVVPAEERKKVKLCKEYLAYANSLSYPIRSWNLRSCNARTLCIKKLIIPVRIEMASTAIEVKGYSEKEWQIIPKAGIQQLRTFSSLIKSRNIENTMFYYLVDFFHIKLIWNLLENNLQCKIS